MVFRKTVIGINICWALLFLTTSLQGQCPITVSAGPDKVVCNSGGSTSLDGVINGNYLDFRWSPLTGLGDPNSLTPSVTVTGTVTYTLTAAAFDPSAPNLFTNPGFESGTSGYSTGYSYSATPITPGTYILTTSPELVVNNFPPCDDHTFGNGTGNLMLVNGNGNANTQVWCQSVPVMPNSWYFLEAWALVSPITPPALQFSVNGTLIGTPAYLSANGCDWQNFTATWFSGTSSSATVCVFDVSGTGNGLFGNDFALDDLFMSKACTVSDQVKVEVANVNAVLQPSIQLPCTALETGITLNGSGSSSGPGITYEWDGPGILSGGNTPTPVVNEPGTYTLTVSLHTGSETCSDVASINVISDPFTVMAEAIVLEELNCQVNSVTIDGSASSAGPNITYAWSPITGILSGGNTPQPEVNAPGIYTLTVTHQLGNCTSTASVTVNQNLAPAIAVATANTTLPCQGPGSVTLSGSGSSTGPAFLYTWTGPGIVSGASTLNNCTVNASGIYTLLVTNDISGCTSIDTAIVLQSGIAPIVQISTQGQLSCLDTTMTLNSTGSSFGPGFSYTWSSTNGNILSSLEGASIQIDSSGTYQLLITNQQTGCTASANVQIQGNYSVPLLQFDSTLVFNCIADSLEIIGTPQSVAFPQYSWSTTNGSITSGGNTLSPWVNTPGSYLLLASDSLSGCSTTYWVEVIADTLSPSILFQPPGALTCIQTETVLSAQSTPNSVPFWYFSAPSGSPGTGILMGENSFQPLVNAAGTYVLTLIDTLNGCSGVDSLVVLENKLPPVVEAGQDTLLTCTVSSILISAAGPLQQVSYQWSNGDIGLQTVVNQPSQLVLTATDSLTGCFTTDTVLVEQSTDVPVISISPPNLLTCSQNSTEIVASFLPTLSYQWTYLGTGGGILSGATSSTVMAGSAGTYTLIITDDVNSCTNEYTVTVQQSTTLPVANAGPPQVLSCGQSSAQLEGTLSSVGSQYQYQWSTLDGQIQQGATTLSPTISAPGTYWLTVTDTLNGCSATAQVVVDNDSNVPNVVINDPGTLTCAQSNLLITSLGSSVGTTFQYNWTGPGLLSDPELTTATINQPGLYTLAVLNIQNNCSSSATVLILEDRTPPLANIMPPTGLITCDQTQIDLDASASTLGMEYYWTGPGIVSGTNSMIAVVNVPGSYSLEVVNPLNGCTASATVNVGQDIEEPLFSILPIGSLNCFSSSISLQASSNASNYIYTWMGPGIIGGANSNEVFLNLPGDYSLTATNANNGCTGLQSIEVTGDFQVPIAVAEANEILNCLQSTVSISGVGSSMGMNYSWSGPGIVSGSSSLTPIVNLPGAYQLVITDPNNGCTNQAEVMVIEDRSPPIAQANTPEILSCIQTQINLNSIGSSAGMNYSWSGPGILSGANSESPLVNAAGTYELLVTNPTSGCSAISEVVVVEDRIAPVAIAGPNQSYSCEDDFLTLTGSSNLSFPAFEWQALSGEILTGALTNTITVAAMAGSYVLFVTNPTNGCVSSDTVLVREVQLLFPQPKAVPPTCFQPLGTLLFEGGDGSFRYSIDGGNTFTADSIFRDLPAGNYQLIAQSSTGCEDTTLLILPSISTVSIQLPSFINLELGGSTLLQPILNLPSNALDNLLWTPSEGLSCVDCLTPVASPSVETTYQLQITSKDGCSDTARITLTVRAAGDIYVPTIFHAGGPWENATFFPQTDLTVLDYQLQVFDRWGSLLYLTNELVRGWDGKARGKWQEPGVYTYLIQMKVVNRAGQTEERVLVGDVTLIR